MKQLLRSKRTDAFLQVLAFAIPFIIAAVEKKDHDLIICYYTVGAVQSVSCICHLFVHSKYKEFGRNAYTRLWAFIMCIGIVLLISGTANNSTAEGFAFVFGLVMLIASPMMALWYFYISVEEIYMIQDMINKDDAGTRAS